MHKLTITLKQHTPLIHFQHDQDGATLRASEVKPKLDKYILSILSKKEKEVGKAAGWLKSNNKKCWLDYRMRIEAGNRRNIALQEFPTGENDGVGLPLYSTNKYPDDKNIILIGNMGGRVRDELLNFVMFDYVDLIVFTDKEALCQIIRDNVPSFFVETNMGNRTSKGFGSFLVEKIDNADLIYNVNSDLMISFNIIPSNNSRIDDDNGMKAIFYIVNTLWNNLKKQRFQNRVPSQDKRNVFLKVFHRIPADVARVPSPLYFKPIIKDKNDQKWVVELLLFLNFDVIKFGESKKNDFYNILDNTVKKVLKNSYYYKEKKLTINDLTI